MHWNTEVRLTEIVQIGGAAVAFGIALWQYVKAQRWKRAEFVAAELKTFNDDIAVQLAMTMLDWQLREIELFRYNDDSSKEKVRVDYKLVASALLPHVEYSGFSREEAAIRDVFDRFLGFLERFESFIKAGLVKTHDFEPYLHYWTSVLSGNYGDIRQTEVLPRFWAFVDFYGYDGVRSLVTRYQPVRYHSIH